MMKLSKRGCVALYGMDIGLLSQDGERGQRCSVDLVATGMANSQRMEKE